MSLCAAAPLSARPNRFFLLGLGLAACFSYAEPAPAQAGYACSFEKEGDNGTFSANFEIPRQGPPSERVVVQWEAPVGGLGTPRISAAFYSDSAGRFSMENGYVRIGWHVHDPRRRPLTLSLQLRSRPGLPPYGRGAFASEFTRSSGPYSLAGDWSDIAAFARGARALHLIAVDRKHRLVATAPIDATVFARAEPAIAAALAEVGQIINNPGQSCAFLENLKSNDIILT